MSSATERKAHLRELRRLGYRGQVAFQIHENGVDQLVALGELTEAEGEDLERVSEAVKSLINDGGLARLANRLVACLDVDKPSEPVEPVRPSKISQKPEPPLFTY